MSIILLLLLLRFVSESNGKKSENSSQGELVVGQTGGPGDFESGYQS